MGSIYERGSKLWFSVKGRDGKWGNVPSGFSVGEEAQALEALAKVEEQLRGEEKISPGGSGPLTVQAFSRYWIGRRRELIPTWKSDESRLKNYVLLEIGNMVLGDVRPHHVVEVFRKLRLAGKIAPKTIHNAYGVLRSLYRDARIEGLVKDTPCILTKHQLGPKTDKNPEWRRTAVFARAELEALVSDKRVPMDRRVFYGLLGIAALRHGEAAGLRWRNVERDVEPLGRLLIATSYDLGRTKTHAARPVPIHPALASLLAVWKLSGWEAQMGRKPEPDDLVVPLPKSAKGEAGRMRQPQPSLKRLHKDLALLGYRARRVHDLRRTMISLARSDGAIKDILSRATHTPPTDVIEGYTSFEWEVVCREVMKLQLNLRRRGEVITLATAVGAPQMPAGDDRANPPNSGSSKMTSAKFPTVLPTVAALQRKSPGSLWASEASSLRGVGDLNP